MGPDSEGNKTYRDFLKVQHPSLSSDYSPPMQGHPSDSLINSERVADNIFENEEGEKVVDLGDGFLNLDKGYGRRRISWDEFENISRFLDVPDNRGRPKFVFEDEKLYIKKGNERREIDDIDVDFRYAFPELRDIAGGATLPPEEQGEEETSLEKKLLTGAVAGSLVFAGVGSFLAWDYDDDGLANHEEIFGNTDWRDPDTSGDGLQDGTAVDLGLNPVERHPSVSAAYQGGLRGDNALAFQDINVTQEYLQEVADHISELDDPGYVENVVSYLSEEPDHISALIASDGEVSELGFEFMEELSPEPLRMLSDVPLHGTSEEFVQAIDEMNATMQIDYIESVIQNGNLSELGVYATPELPPQIVAEVSPYDLDETGKNLVQYIQNQDLNNQTEYVNSVIHEGELSDLGVYAIPHLPAETVEELSEFSLYNVSEDLVHSLTEADLSNHTKYISSVEVNGNISAFGVYATPELPPQIVAEISPYDLDETGKNLVQYIKDEDIQNQTEYVNGVIHEGELSDLGVYAIPHLEPEVVSELSPFDLDEIGEELVEALVDAEKGNRTEYVNATEVNGNLSELGVYSIPYLTPEGVEIVSPYPFDEVGRDHVQGIKDLDLNNQTAYTDAVSLNGELSRLGVDYIGEITPEALDYLSELSYTEMNRSFAENVSVLPGDVQLDLSGGYAADEQITREQLDQAYFLNLLQDKGELEKYLSDYEATEMDASGDSFPNLFSLQQSDIINWDEHNELYLVKFFAEDPDAPGHGSSLFNFNLFLDDLQKYMDIPEENIIKRIDENATFSNFENITDDLEEKMDENDILVKSLMGHGSSHGFFSFRRSSVTYDMIAEQLDPIPGYQKVLIEACYSGHALPELERENRVLVTASDDERKAGDGTMTRHYWGPNSLFTRDDLEVKAFDGRVSGGPWGFEVLVDRDDSGYISPAEAFFVYRGLHADRSLVSDDYFNTLKEADLLEETDDGYLDVDSQNPQFSDPSNIGYDLLFPIVPQEDDRYRIDS